jgi:hypothetical protein
MEIIQIQNQNGREVAYVFIREQGKIVKLLIEDWTGGFGSTIAPTPAYSSGQTGVTFAGPDRPLSEMPKPRSIVPPQFASMMKPPLDV